MGTYSGTYAEPLQYAKEYIFLNRITFYMQSTHNCWTFFTPILF
jgi:hypothetical protein